MIAKVLLLALLVAAASSTPINQDNSMVGYGKAVGMFMQAWKKMMPCGFPSENIPALAPFTLDFEDFHYLYEPSNVYGNVSNIRISGLNNFEVLSSSYNATTMTRSFDIIYPEIQILGSMALEGTFSLGGLIVPLHENILLNKKITGWRFITEYTFGQSLTNKNGLRISDFDLKYYIADVQVGTWDQELSIASNTFFNKYFAKFSQLFSEEIQPYVNPLFAKYVLPTIDDLLSNMDITQLTNFFISQAEMWNNAGCSVQV